MINIIIDSHIGELYLISPMLHKWHIDGELKNISTINVISLSQRHTEASIRKELFWANDIYDFNVFEFDVVNSNLGRFSKFKKAINFFHFIFCVFFKRNANINFLPYDQKNYFYSLVLAILHGRNFAVPHTTGPEVYNQEVLVESKHKRKRKPLPVLIQDKKSKTYFKMLGFEKQIPVGAYHSLNSFYIDLERTYNNISPKKNIEVVLFSLGVNKNMFSMDEWVDTHYSIFNFFSSKSNNIDFLVKLHPSQNKNQFLQTFNEFNNLIKVVDVHPEFLSHRCDMFISIMTSAAHHAINKEKVVANFGLPALRESVRNFGNDPYPYKLFNIPELTTSEGLQAWFDQGLLKVNDKQHCNNKTSSRVSSLREICDEYDRLCLGSRSNA